MFESLSRPHLLIIDAQNTLTAQERRKERDQKLISQCINCYELHYCTMDSIPLILYYTVIIVGIITFIIVIVLRWYK